MAELGPDGRPTVQPIGSAPRDPDIEGRVVLLQNDVGHLQRSIDKAHNYTLGLLAVVGTTVVAMIIGFFTLAGYLDERISKSLPPVKSQIQKPDQQGNQNKPDKPADAHGKAKTGGKT